MSQPITGSYVDMGRSLEGRPSEENTTGTLAFSANRKNSGTSNEGAHRGSIGFEEPVRDHSPDLARPRNASPQPSFRRPSIAQVLGRRFSRSSQASGSAPDPSSSFNLAAVQEHEDGIPRPSRKKRRSRPKNRRRRSSKTRDHGDFHAYHAQAHPVKKPNAPDETALQVAIKDGDVIRVEQLLTDDSTIGDTSSNPLQTAALEGNKEIVNLLLKSGNFGVDARDSRDRTAIYCAASRGHDSIVRILLNHEAKPLSPDEERIAKLELGRWHLYDREAQINHHENTTSQRLQTFEGAEMTSEPEENSGEDIKPTQSSSPVPSRDALKDVDHLFRLIIGSAETIKERRMGSRPLTKSNYKSASSKPSKGNWNSAETCPIPGIWLRNCSC
jgi:hypothetical protein